MILLGHDQTVADWVAQRCNKPPFCAYDCAIGVLDAQGTLTGGFVFTGYNRDGIELSLAGRGVKERNGWRAVLCYVFETLGCKRLQMHTRKSNTTVRRMLPKLGMKYEGTARKFYGDEHGLIFSLTTDDLPVFRARWKL